MDKLVTLRKEKKMLEAMLQNKQHNIVAKEVFLALQPYFDEIDNMVSYYPIGKVRLVRLFLQSDLSEDKELFSCYGRFANLIEDVEV